MTTEEMINYLLKHSKKKRFSLYAKENEFLVRLYYDDGTQEKFFGKSPQETLRSACDYVAVGEPRD